MRLLMDLMRALMGHLSENDLIDFALDGLQGDARLKAEAHLKDCRICRSALRQWMEVQEGLAALAPEQEVPADLSERIIQSVRNGRYPL